MREQPGEFSITGRVDPATGRRPAWFRFHPDGFPFGDAPLTVRIDREECGEVCLLRIVQAALLGTPATVTVREEPETPGEPLRDGAVRLELVDFAENSPGTTAELVARLPESERNPERLRTLMNFRVFENHPREFSRHTKEFIDSHEIIQWWDESVTALEVQEDRDGGPGRVLFRPPLASLAELLGPGNGGGDPEARVLERWRELGNLADLSVPQRTFRWDVQM